MRSLPLLAALSLVACGVEDVDIGDGASFTEAQVTLGELRLHDDIESIAYLSWEQHEAALTYVEYSVDEDVWLCSPAVSRAAGEVGQRALRVGGGRQRRRQQPAPRRGPAPVPKRQASVWDSARTH